MDAVLDRFLKYVSAAGMALPAALVATCDATAVVSTDIIGEDIIGEGLLVPPWVLFSFFFAAWAVIVGLCSRGDTVQSLTARAFTALEVTGYLTPAAFFVQYLAFGIGVPDPIFPAFLSFLISIPVGAMIAVAGRTVRKALQRT